MNLLVGQESIHYFKEKSLEHLIHRHMEHEDADGFLRAVLFYAKTVNPFEFTHKPIVVKDGSEKLGDIIHLFQLTPENMEDDVFDQDLILLWSDKKQIITGADILGRLMRGIVNRGG